MINETRDTWVDDEDASDLTFLFDKDIREGLTAEEEEEKAFLVRLYESGK